MNFHNKNQLLKVVIFFLLVTASTLIFYFRRTPKNEKLPKWLTYDKKVDLITGDGRLINFNESTGGILILSKGYEEKTKNINATVINLKNGEEKTITIFKDLPEFTAVKFLPNSINGSKFWVTTFHKRTCTKKLKTGSSKMCKYNLYELDISSGELVLKKEGKVRQETLGIYPLVHDPLNNIVWLAIESRQDNYHTYDHQSRKTIKQIAYLTDFIKYDAKTNQITSPVQTGRKLATNVAWGSWTPYGIGLPGKASIADVDKNGDLFIITECAHDLCRTQENNKNTSVVKIPADFKKMEQKGKIPLFTYGYPLSIHENLQLTIDSSKQILYLATKSFDQTKESMLFAYEIDRSRTFQLGGQPTQYDDDVRGIDTLNGKLLLGSFNGLGIYDFDNDRWKILTTDDGLKSNNVELVKTTNNGGVCVIHENEGASCLLDNFQGYLEVLKKN